MRRLLSLVATLWLLPVSAHAQDLVRYTVRRGDTCASISRRFFGDPRRYDILHEHNPGLGPPPHRLVAGATLLLPRTPTALAPGPDARITATRHRVEARAPDDAAWAPAAPGLALNRGYRVNTFDDSAADISFRDTSSIHVREHTLVIVYGPSRELARRVPSRATLERGTLRSRLGELTDGARIDVATPGAETTLRGGEAVVTVDAQGTSRIANHGGDAQVVTPGGAVRLPAGTGTEVARGGVPSRPRPLPDAPRWATSDESGRVIGITGHGGTLRGEWTAVEGAARYRVEVARGADGSDVIAAVEVPADVTRFEAHRIPAGVYYVSVATIDRGYFEGLPSPRRAMRVLEARLIPPGGAPADPPPPYDPGDPSVPFRPPVVPPGTWIVAPMGFRCSGGAEEPATDTLATLTVPGRIVAHCTDAANRDVSAFEVIVAPIRVLVVPPSAAAVPRRAESVVPLTITSDATLPPRLLVTTEPPIDLVRLERAPDDSHRLVVRPGERAPRRVQVTLSVPAAQDRVPVATFHLRVVDPAPAVAAPRPRIPLLERAPPPDAPLAEALSSIPLPSSLAARAPHLHGVRFTLASAYVPDANLVRTSGAIGTRVPGTPLLVAAALPLDASGDHAPLARRGQLDPHVGLALIALDVPRFALLFDLSTFIPTTRAGDRLPDLRFTPSIELTAHALPALTFRTRQGAIVDASSAGTRLWSAAYALDVRPIPELAVSAELDTSVGRDASRTRRASALGLGAALHLSPLVLSGAYRLGLGADGRLLHGDHVVALSLTWRPR